MVAGLGAYLTAKGAELDSKSWHIIQLAETAVPGEFKLWCLVGGALPGPPAAAQVGCWFSAAFAV